MYVYENHLSGGVYMSDEWLEWEDLYCEQCGDSDNFIGTAEDADELRELLKEYYYEDYIEEVVKEYFG